MTVVPSPRRVAYVIHDLRHGGAENQLLTLIAALDRKRYEPLLVCLDGLGDFAARARALGLEPHVLGSRPAGIPRLARLFRREHVSVAQGWLELPSVFARIAGALARVPVVIATELAVVRTTERVRGRLYASLDWVLAPVTDGYVANSDAVAATLLERGFPRAKMTVIPNGVAINPSLGDDEKLRVRTSLGVPPDRALIGMTARLDPEFKDHHTFLRALAALVSEGKPVHGVLVGEGPGRAVLEDTVRRLGISDSVTFAGFRDDAAQVVGAFDVAVLLSYSEGFSNVVLEAMAAGVPLVATDIEPNREAVRDECEGLLVPIRGADEAAAAIRRLLDDRLLGARLGDAARDRARERFSLEAQALSSMDLYDRLLAQNGIR